MVDANARRKRAEELATLGHLRVQSSWHRYCLDGRVNLSPRRPVALLRIVDGGRRLGLSQHMLAKSVAALVGTTRSNALSSGHTSFLGPNDFDDVAIGHSV